MPTANIETNNEFIHQDSLQMWSHHCIQIYVVSNDHSLHGYYMNKKSDTATITEEKDSFDKNYFLLAIKLNKNRTKYANGGADRIIE